MQTSYCIGGMNGNAALAQALNQTAMRTVPMSLYGNYNSDSQAEVDYGSRTGWATSLA